MHLLMTFFSIHFCYCREAQLEPKIHSTKIIPAVLGLLVILVHAETERESLILIETNDKNTKRKLIASFSK